MPTKKLNQATFHKSKAKPAPQHIDTITQEELQVIQSLRVLEAHYKVLRDEIVARLDAGASVEPGALAAEMATRCSRRISFDRLVEVVGEAEAYCIRDEIRPSIHRYLKVSHR